MTCADLVEALRTHDVPMAAWCAAVDLHGYRGYMLEHDRRRGVFRLSRSWPRRSGKWAWRHREDADPRPFVFSPGEARQAVDFALADPLPSNARRTAAAGYYCGWPGLPVPRGDRGRGKVCRSDTGGMA